MRNPKNINMKDVRRYFLGIPLFLLLVAVGPARSDDIESVKAMMWDGDFYEAAEIAARLGGLEGYTLAAAALAIHGYEIAPESEKQEHFLRAIDYAEKAIEIDQPYPLEYFQIDRCQPCPISKYVHLNVPHGNNDLQARAGHLP